MRQNCIPMQELELKMQGGGVTMGFYGTYILYKVHDTQRSIICKVMLSLAQAKSRSLESANDTKTENKVLSEKST